MSTYSYIAKDLDGKKHSGKQNADTQEALRQRLRQEELFLVSCREEEASKSSGYKLKLKEVTAFCRQFSTMMSAGVTIVRAIDILYLRQTKPKLKERFLTLYESVQKGGNLSDAMEEQGNAFPQLLISMVRSGESSGTLDTVMQRMAVHYEKEMRTSNKIRTSLMYPILLVCLSIVVVAGLLAFVMPGLFSLFGDGPLPWPTQVIVDISDFLREKWMFALIGVLLFVLLCRMLYKVPTIRYGVDYLMMHLPRIGKLNKIIYTARMARTLASLYASGITMLDCIRSISAVLNNAYIARQLDQVMEDLQRGDTLSSSIAKTNVFDPILFSMIYIGEESGSLDRILDSTASYFDDEAETAMERMVAMIEPTMIIVLGIMIAFIIISVLLPILNSYTNILG